jgi:hypothetical protein
VLPPSDSGLKFLFAGDSSETPEGSVADRELGNDFLVFLCTADAIDLNRAKGGLVEVTCLAAPADGELWRDADLVCPRGHDSVLSARASARVVTMEVCAAAGLAGLRLVPGASPSVQTKLSLRRSAYQAMSY